MIIPCAVCGDRFTPKRRGQQRERRCPACRRRWRVSGHLECRLPSEIHYTRTGALTPDALRRVPHDTLTHIASELTRALEAVRFELARRMPRFNKATVIAAARTITAEGMPGMDGTHVVDDEEP